MFIRTKPGDKKPPPATHLHPWVVEAAKSSRQYVPNPARPNVRGVEKGRLEDIRACRPPVLRRGDAVALRFSVTYIEGDKDYYPQYLLTDIIRVHLGPEAANELENTFVKPVTVAEALQDGEIVDGKWLAW